MTQPISRLLPGLTLVLLTTGAAGASHSDLTQQLARLSHALADATHVAHDTAHLTLHHPSRHERRAVDRLHQLDQAAQALHVEIERSSYPDWSRVESALGRVDQAFARAAAEVHHLPRCRGADRQWSDVGERLYELRHEVNDLLASQRHHHDREHDYRGTQYRYDSVTYRSCPSRPAYGGYGGYRR